MTNQVLTQIDAIINKSYDIIKALDNDYIVETYTPEISMERGKYGFNILPMLTVQRFPSAERDMQNLIIDVFMHYDMEADDIFKTTWTKFMIKANVVLRELYDKTKFIVGISDVDISIDFSNPILEKERVISLTFKCEYKIFATR